MPARVALGRVWLCALALSAGAVAGEGALGWPLTLAALCAGVVLAGFRRRPAFLLAGLAFASFGAGAISALGRGGEDAALVLVAKEVPRCHLHGRLTESAGGLGDLLHVDEIDCEGRAPLRRAGLVATDALGLDPGTQVRASGYLVPLREDPFDSARARLGALAAFHASDLEAGRVHGVLPAAAARMRSALRAAAADLPPDRSSLLRGITIGDTTGMPEVDADALRRAGLTHLVAVSGSNVAIVLTVLGFAARRWGPAGRVALAGLGLLFFVAVVGPEPSVLRAAAMAGISLAALSCGRRAEPLYGLGLALIWVIAVRPGMVFSVGLHLSAAATAGIVLWGRPLANRLVALPRPAALALAATLAAQIAVAPVLVLVFGELSVVAPLANLLVFAAVPPATVLGFGAGVLGLVHPPAGAVLASVTSPLLGWVLGVGRALGEPVWVTASVPREAGWALAGVVTAAAAVTLRGRV